MTKTIEGILRWYEKELFYIWQNNLKEAETREIATADIIALLHGVVPEKRKEEYYHQNHWKANVYNEAITTMHQNIDGLKEGK